MSDEYTPTTDGVRWAYATFGGMLREEGPERTFDTATGEFNRWLAEHDRQVKAEAWDEGFMRARRNPSPLSPWHADNPYRGNTAADIASLLEQSSLGTPEAQALRATVSDERAAEILRMADITTTENGG